MVDDTQQSLLEIKVDKVEKKVDKLIRLVEGDESLGVPGLREYIKTNEAWKKTTEEIIKHGDSKNIIIDRRNIWQYVLIIILGVIVFFFALNSLRNSEVLIPALNIYYGFNNRLYTDLLLWIVKNNPLFN